MFGKFMIYKGNRISPFQMTMLVLIMHRPMYGYEVVKELRERYEGIWVPQTGAVYPALRKLQDHGLLTVENIDGKDYYHVSDEGVQWIKQELTELPSGTMFMMRTLEVLGEVAIRKPTTDEGFIPVDLQPPEDQLKHLHHLREMVRRNLQMLDMHIAELEKEKENGGER